MNEKDFKQDIITASRRHGFNPIVGDIFKKQEEWFNWWRGDVNGFHIYSQKVNGINKQFQRQTMNMPKKLCEDYHSLVWNENCEIKINDENANKIVNQVLEDNNFETEFGSIVELAFGMGNSYLIEYLQDNETQIDFLSYDNAIPLAFNNGRVKALVTFNRIKLSDAEGDTSVLTHLTYHYLENKKYNIKHETYISDNESKLGKLDNTYLADVFGDKNIIDEYTITFDTDEPFFQQIKPNIKNHHDIHSPHGVSIYATLLSYFHTVDTLFDLYETEAQGNRTRIIVDGKVLKTRLEINDDGTANYINYFDESDTTFVALSTGDNDDIPITHIKGEFSFDQLEFGIDKIVQLIGFRSGLGKNFYSFKDGNIYQNEKNVMTTNADTYKTKKKHEIILRRVIKQMVKSILRLEKIASRYSGEVDNLDIEIVFDDSIAIDDEAIEAKYIDLAEKGYIPKWMAVEQVLKVSEDEAKAMVLEAETAESERNKAYLADYMVDEEEEVEDNEEPNLEIE